MQSEGEVPLRLAMVELGLSGEEPAGGDNPECKATAKSRPVTRGHSIETWRRGKEPSSCV